MPRTMISIVLASVLASQVGCGRGEPTLVPAEGRILYKGEPVDAGTIVFTPDSERGNVGPIAWAEIQPDGKFRLRSDEREGAVPGWHRVTVAGASKRQLIPVHYRDPERSRLMKELKVAGGAVEVQLD